MNRDKLSKIPLIELLHNINMSIEDCLYQALSKRTDEEKRSRCKKIGNCYDCLSAFLNEGGRKMYIDGEWLEECEASAKFKDIKAKLADTQGELLRAKVLLTQIRHYYSATAGWDMYEDDVIELIGKGAEK